MIDRDFYLSEVYPRLEFPIVIKYPHVHIEMNDNYHSLAEHSVCMLVALTGTGKTTTLKYLKQFLDNQQIDDMNIIPSRREVADWIAIPTAQVLLDEPIQAVSNRVKRFYYTRTFAEHVEGGMARAFSWINVHNDYSDVIISEGIRGTKEFSHALEHCLNWKIVELTLHPLIRLQRLSSRDDQFDKADGELNVSFLPIELQEEAIQLVESNEITAKALTIMRAEAQNYGLYPFADGDQFDNYHQIEVDALSPQQVAQQVYAVMNEGQQRCR